METIIENFILLTKIPHCSYDAGNLRDFLINYAQEREYNIEVDSSENILFRKGTPKLCLQAHYDMVCMGEAPQIETYVESGWLKAKNASLGADNGIAIAMMMCLMDKDIELEFLFTADEEVGLIGAGALEFDLQSSYMLNLDFEDEAEVCIGCAGGADIVGQLHDEYIEGSSDCYELSVKDLPGGHSGVDIDKGIPSAIGLLAEYLSTNHITQLCSIYAGERRNSIPANAVAIVRSEVDLTDSKEVKARKLTESPKVLKSSRDIIKFIHNFRDGVRSHNTEFDIPQSSINLAIINSDEVGKIEMQTSARSMSMEGLEVLIDDTVLFFERYNFTVQVDDKYPAWRPETNKFADLVESQMQNFFGRSKIVAIHAGLECGVILKRYPNIQFASIGPTIKYPHSTREMVDIESVKRTQAVVESIVEKLK